MMGLMGLWGFLVMGLFWGVLVFLAVALVRGLFPLGGSTTPNIKNQSSALDILNERYARGDISSDDYNRMKRELKE